LEHAAAALETVSEEYARLTTDVTRLNNRVIADSSKLHTLSASVPESWRTTTAEQLVAATAELGRLKSAGVADQFRQLEDDAARRGEWAAQLVEVEQQVADLPADARIPVADAERADAEARTAFDQAHHDWQQARDLLAELNRQAARYEELKREVAAAEVDARVHGKLDELLGRGGLQRELVRDAEARIVALAHDTVKNLSDGDLSIELDRTDDGGDEAFALLVRRADDPTPIGVNYLSGSQKFRVAISVALAIGRFAAGQARPLECVIIDEGFGSLDKGGLRSAAEELNRLKQYLRRIILVSHQEEFTDNFPVVIRLAKGEAGTTVQAVRR
jgi:DNA repair exonuclease SbcCD ATPase subunit